MAGEQPNSWVFAQTALTWAFVVGGTSAIIDALHGVPLSFYLIAAVPTAALYAVAVLIHYAETKPQR